MKEQLISLKDNAILIAKEQETFKKQKNFFNMKVEEQKIISNITEVANGNEDSYLAALYIHTEFPQISLTVNKLKEEHPKYGIKRIKELATNELMGILEIQEQDKACLKMIVENYLMYESCGFFKVKELDDKIKELEGNVKSSANDILNESKDKAIKFGNSVKQTMEPYAKIAKSQLTEASISAKETINKESKKLIKALEKLEKKTRK